MKSRSKQSKSPYIVENDLFKFRLPTALALSPDERRIAYTCEQMDETDNCYYAHLWIIDRATSEQKQYTFGKIHDASPIWSPDGKRIAFCSAREKRFAIYIISASGGAEEKVTELEASVSNLQWTPDGKQLVFCMRYNDSHYIEDETKKKQPPVYRHVTRLFYRLDGAGFLPKDVFQVYALDLTTAKLRKITSGKRDNLGATLSPDGKYIAYHSNRAKDQDIDALLDDLFIIPFKGGKERRIPTPPGPVSAPAFSPNGKLIAYLGHANPDDAWGVTNIHVWKVSADGKGKAKDLMPKFDRMAYDGSITDTASVGDSGLVYWSGDSKRIFFISSDTGATNLYYIPVGGGKPTRVFKADCHIKLFSITGKGKVAAVMHADLTNPGEIMSFPAEFGGEKRYVQHTQLSRFLKTEKRLGRTRDIRFKGYDGTEIQGWLVTPPHFNRNKKYPAILQIHGGPRAQYAHSFFHEMQYLAANGYVVFYTNPRGGHGRGETWADAIAGGWGDIDYADVMAAADWLEKQPYVNAKKMGVGGGSYGGYMTNWIIGHTNRFAAAITMRSLCDLKSFVGSSDIGWSLAREFAGYPWTNPENYEKRSPITYFHKVKTPVLILHNEEDLRCHIEQAEQMFVKLKVLKKTVEMVRFPQEPHGLSRHGRPDRRIARLQWIKKWFDRYLK